MAKRKKVTKYQRVQKASAKRCKNPTKANQEAVKKAKDAYVKDAVKKGKSTAEARKIANKADTCKPFKKKK